MKKASILIMLIVFSVSIGSAQNNQGDFSFYSAWRIARNMEEKMILITAYVATMNEYSTFRDQVDETSTLQVGIAFAEHLKQYVINAINHFGIQNLVTLIDKHYSIIENRDDALFAVIVNLMPD
jgi:hypothetical protein